MTRTHDATARTVRASLCASLLVLGSACVGGLLSEQGAGLARRYDLVTYNGSVLPVATGNMAAVSAEPGGPSYTCSISLVAQQLDFSAPEAVTQVTQRRLACDVPRYNASSADTLAGRLATAGDAIVLSFGEGTPSLIIMRGHITGSSLQLDLVEYGTTRKSYDPTLRVFRPSP